MVSTGGQRVTAPELLGLIGGGALLAAQNALQAWQARQHAEKTATAAENKASSLGTNLGPRVQRLEELVAELRGARETTTHGRRRRR